MNRAKCTKRKHQIVKAERRIFPFVPAFKRYKASRNSFFCVQEVHSAKECKFAERTAVPAIREVFCFFFWERSQVIRLMTTRGIRRKKSYLVDAKIAVCGQKSVGKSGKFVTENVNNNDCSWRADRHEKNICVNYVFTLNHFFPRNENTLADEKKIIL